MRGKGADSTVKAVIFDIDDTLIDFTETKNLAIRESVKAMIDKGLSEDFESLHREFRRFYWERGIEDQHIFQKFFMEKYGKIDYPVLASAILAYRKAKEGVLKPYPGAKNLLIQLKERGLKLAILSDAPKLEAYLRLCAVSFDDFFDLILTKDDVGVSKPHSRGFGIILKKFSIKAEECVMIGDAPDKDMEGARNLGIKTILANYSSRKIEKPDLRADYTASSVSEIWKIISRI
jgi:putative hydrolase of the HAD superfamily